MALIRSFEPKNSAGRGKTHGEVRATFETFSDGEKKYVQIDTYGSLERVNRDTPSQKIQLDENSAKELVEILRRAYDL